jgi:hypothetical protein
VTSPGKAALVGPTRPLGSPEIPQFYLPARASHGVYTPRLYGAATIHFADRRRRVEEERRVAFLAPLDPAQRTVDWERGQPTDVTPDQLIREPPKAASYLPLPAGAMELTVFTRWAKKFDRWLARTQRLELQTKQEPIEAVTLGPKRGGVSVELVAIVWELG